ncbi:MAG: hypothetical protein ACE5GO_12620 [Anaerolineales bacterium]
MITPDGSTLVVGEPLTVLYGVEIVDGLVWVEVMDSDGRVGWIPQAYLLIISPTPADTPTPTDVPAAAGTLIVTGTLIATATEPGTATPTTEPTPTGTGTPTVTASPTAAP